MQNDIFREEAVNSYWAQRSEEVLPPLVQPRTFLLLWLMVIVVVALLGLTLTIQLPVYGQGIAFIDTGTTAESPATDSSDKTALTVLLPDVNPQELRTSQAIYLISRSGVRHEATVTDIRQTAADTDDLRNIVGDSLPARLLPASAAVLAIRVDLPESTTESDLFGTVYQAEAEVGSQRMVQVLIESLR